MHHLCALQQRHVNATFLFVYITEAHAVDEWPIGDAYPGGGGRGGRVVHQPRSASERAAEARHFVERFKMDLKSGAGEPGKSSLGWSVAVDVPELADPFAAAYAPWPTRFYVIERGEMRFVANPTDRYGYDLAGLEKTLGGFGASKLPHQ